MTKKDYVLIAVCIKNTRLDQLYTFGMNEAQLDATERFASRLVRRLCHELVNDNDRFDDKRFTEATGVKVE